MNQSRQQQTDQPGQELVVSDEMSSMPATAGAHRAVFLPESFGQALQMAKLLSSGIGVRPWMRGNESACMMVLQQAMRWGMDPYAVANKSYYTNDTLCYESQLVNAVINTSGQLLGRLSIAYSGDTKGGKGHETLVCRVTGRVRGAPDEDKVLDQPLNTIAIRNSPLWNVNPKLQLAYHATRSWARLYMPEVLLGVYTNDEIVDGEAQKLAEQTRPATAPAPDRRDYVDEGSPAAEQVEDAEFSPVDEQQAEESVETGANPRDSADKGPEKAEIGEKQAEKGGLEPKKAKEITPKPASQGENTSDSIPQELALDDPIPLEPDEWAVWERETLAALAEAPTMKEVSALRKRVNPAIEQARDDLADRIQEAFGDKIVSLTKD